MVGLRVPQGLPGSSSDVPLLLRSERREHGMQCPTAPAVRQAPALPEKMLSLGAGWALMGRGRGWPPERPGPDGE